MKKKPTSAKKHKQLRRKRATWQKYGQPNITVVDDKIGFVPNKK